MLNEAVSFARSLDWQAVAAAIGIPLSLLSVVLSILAIKRANEAVSLDKAEKALAILRSAYLPMRKLSNEIEDIINSASQLKQGRLTLGQEALYEQLSLDNKEAILNKIRGINQILKDHNPPLPFKERQQSATCSLTLREIHRERDSFLANREELILHAYNCADDVINYLGGKIYSYQEKVLSISDAA